jgi:hypothetical protein
MLAEEKLEQLRGLAWGFDGLGLPRSDVSSDLSVSPERPDGGPGLTASPPGALDRDTRGYCDFTDGNGNVVAVDEGVPPGAVYVRRWSIELLRGQPDTIALHVVVRRMPGGPLVAHLVTVRTRKFS